ncbi:MAG: hypothetical protein JWP89_6463 [Schlesneria sp.]|nr:hypothetical protein [Schlesneria sp.]
MRLSGSAGASPSQKTITPIRLWTYLVPGPLEAGGDKHVVADHFEHLVHAELAALDLELGRVAGSLNAFREFGRLATGDDDRDLLLHPIEGQHASHFVPTFDRLGGCTLKGEVGVLLGVEKVGASQVLVPLGVVCIDTVYLGCDVEPGGGGVAGIDCECPGQILEPAVSPTQADMRDFEGDGRMGCLQCVVIRPQSGSDRHGSHENEAE